MCGMHDACSHFLRSKSAYSKTRVWPNHSHPEGKNAFRGAEHNHKKTIESDWESWWSHGIITRLFSKEHAECKFKLRKKAIWVPVRFSLPASFSSFSSTAVFLQPKSISITLHCSCFLLHSQKSERWSQLNELKCLLNSFDMKFRKLFIPSHPRLSLTHNIGDAHFSSSFSSHFSFFPTIPSIVSRGNTTRDSRYLLTKPQDFFRFLIAFSLGCVSSSSTLLYRIWYTLLWCRGVIVSWFRI